MAVRITSVASSANATGTLKAGAVVTFTIGLDQPAFTIGLDQPVSTIGLDQPPAISGLPFLVMNTGGIAAYDPVLSRPSATQAMMYFHYTVGASDATSDLAVLSMNLASSSVHPDGSLAGATPTFTGLQIGTTVPVVSSVAASPGFGALEVGQTVTFTLTFSEPVKLSGAVTLTLNDGGIATYIGGPAATTTLLFRTIITTGQNAAALAITGVDMPAGASVVAQSNPGRNADLGAAAKTFGALSVDTSGPTVRSLVIPDDASREAAGRVDLVLVMSKIVSITGGTPTLSLNDGGIARYVAGAGTNALVFTTTVAPGQATPDLAVSALNLNGAVVADRAGRVANLAGAVTTPPNTLELSKPAVSVTQIIATPSSAGPLGISRTVTFTASISREVIVAGTPTLTLNNGGTATYIAAASTSTSLVFRTTIAARQNAANLAATALNLNGAAVTVPSTPLAFTSPVQYLVAGNLGAAAIADIDNDAQPDLLAGGYRTTVSLGDGKGGFFPATSINTLTLQGLAVADVNRDGNPDIFASSIFGGLTVSLGNGPGGFVTTQTVPASPDLAAWAT